MPSAISTDVLIVGAGVAGLWLNARLRHTAVIGPETGLLPIKLRLSPL